MDRDHAAPRAASATPARGGWMRDRFTHPLAPALAMALAVAALGATTALSAPWPWTGWALWLLFAATAGYAISGSV